MFSLVLGLKSWAEVQNLYISNLFIHLTSFFPVKVVTVTRKDSLVLQIRQHSSKTNKPCLMDATLILESENLC